MLFAGILAYVALQLAIGVIVARRVRTEDDYFVAGRRLGPVLASTSVFATWFGAESCLGAAGAIYTDGVGRTTVEPFAYGLCLLLMGLLFAAAFWRARITTLADLFRRRFGASVEVIAAVVLIPTSVLWAAAQVRAFGHVLTSASALDLRAGILLAAAVAVVYTALGGLLADVITDFLQAIAIVIGLVVLLVAVVGEFGGVGDAVTAIRADQLRIVGGEQPSWLETIEAWALPVLGSLVAQEAVSRAIAARSSGVARGAGLLGGALYLLVGMIPVALGLLGAHLLPGLDDGEELLPRLAQRLLPAFGYVVFAGALVSAILSTVDTALLVAAGVLSRNLVLAGRSVSEATRLRTARLGVVGLGAVAAALALTSDSVMGLIENASGFGSAGILVFASFGLMFDRCFL